MGRTSALTSLDRGRAGILGLVSFSQGARTALIGVEMVAGAAAKDTDPLELDFTTVDDWFVVETAQERSRAGWGAQPLLR